MTMKQDSLAWATLCSEWPETAYHTLVDMIPEYHDEYSWEKVRTIESIPREKWYSNISLQEIGVKADLILWQEQKLSYEVCAMIKNPKTTVAVGTVYGSHVIVLRFAAQAAISYLPLFHSTDRQKIRVFCGLQPKMEVTVPVIQTPDPIAELKIHMSCQRPTLDDIEVYTGTGAEVWRYSTVDITYVFCQDRTEKKISVAVSIKRAWIEHSSKPALVRNYLTPEYYTRNMHDYSMWSIPAHSEQIQLILDRIPSTTTLVVPGDGLGLVDYLWKGPIVAGDLVGGVGRVQKEDFIKTLLRGRMLKDSSAILVLSYVTGLMSLIEKEQMGKWPGPILWVDSHDECPLTDMVLVSRGVAVRKMPTIRSIRIPTEPEHSPSQQPYSENLLRLESISYFGVKNRSVKYWERMRPFAQAVPWTSIETAVCVVDTVAEAVMVSFQLRNFYFSQTGKMWEPAKPAIHESVLTLYGRTLYVMHESSLALPTLVNMVQWHKEGEVVYFCTRGYATEKVIEYKALGQISTIRLLPLTSSHPSTPWLKVISVNKSVLTLNTFIGIRDITVWSHEFREMYKDWFQGCGAVGWDYWLDQIPVKDDQWVPGPKVKAIMDSYKLRKEFVVADALFMPWAWKSLQDKMTPAIQDARKMFSLAAFVEARYAFT